MIRSVLKDKKGVAALEYSILAGLIVLGVVAAVSTSNIRTSVTGIFTGMTNSLTNAALGTGSASTTR